MIIFKDLLSGDELFSDTYKMELIDDVVYRVQAKMIIVRDDVDDSLLGANPSAEGCDEQGADDQSRSVVNVVHANRLQETNFTKKTFQTHIKKYMKTIMEKLEQEKPDEVEKFKKGAAKFMKEMLSEFKEYQFFQGESLDAEEYMVALMKWDGETPSLYFFKHGLMEEKV